jgi:hypothetical protein
MPLKWSHHRIFPSRIDFDASSRVAFRMQKADAGLKPRVARGPTAFKPEGLPPDVDHDFAHGSGHIRCPACKWIPEKASRWFCIAMGPPENFTGGCGHGWNTFDTRGTCPGCKHQWKHTTCLNCSVTSLHDDWYVVPGTGPQP